MTIETWKLLFIIIGYVFSAIIGATIGMTVVRNKNKPQINGFIRIVYDQDDPERPAMGLVLEDLTYILSHQVITLGIEKIGFPDESRKNQPL